MVNLSPRTSIKLFLFFLTLLVAFFQVLSVCIVYCSHAQFVFDFVLDLVVVVYTTRVYLIKVKVKLTFTCFSL